MEHLCSRGLYFSIVRAEGLDKIVVQKKKWCRYVPGCADVFTFVEQHRKETKKPGFDLVLRPLSIS
jgi:hypothetical protein